MKSKNQHGKWAAGFVAAGLLASLTWQPLGVGRVSAEPPATSQATSQPDGAGVGEESNRDRPPLGGPGARRARRADGGRAREDQAGGGRESREPREGAGRRWRDRRDDRMSDRPDESDDEDAAGRGRFQRGPGFRDARPEIPPEVLDELREVIRTEMPELYERMQSWKEKHPEMFDRALRKFYPAMHEYMMLRERDPKLAQTVIEELRIEIRLRKVSTEYRSLESGDARRAELEKNMGSMIRRQFDIRMERREARLRDYEERLRIEKEKLAREKGRIDEACHDRLEQVKLGEFDDMLDRPRRRGPGLGPPDREPGPEAGPERGPGFGPGFGPDRRPGRRDDRPPPREPGGVDRMDGESQDGPDEGGRGD